MPPFVTIFLDKRAACFYNKPVHTAMRGSHPRASGQSPPGAPVTGHTRYTQCVSRVVPRSILRPCRGRGLFFWRRTMAKEKKQEFVQHITPRDENFSQWYTDVVTQTDLDVQRYRGAWCCCHCRLLSSGLPALPRCGPCDLALFPVARGVSDQCGRGNCRCGDDRFCERDLGSLRGSRAPRSQGWCAVSRDLPRCSCS